MAPRRRQAPYAPAPAARRLTAAERRAQVDAEFAAVAAATGQEAHTAAQLAAAQRRLRALEHGLPYRAQAGAPAAAPAAPAPRARVHIARAPAAAAFRARVAPVAERFLREQVAPLAAPPAVLPRAPASGPPYGPGGVDAAVNEIVRSSDTFGSVFRQYAPMIGAVAMPLATSFAAGGFTSPYSAPAMAAAGAMMPYARDIFGSIAPYASSALRGIKERVHTALAGPPEVRAVRAEAEQRRMQVDTATRVELEKQRQGTMDIRSNLEHTRMLEADRIRRTEATRAEQEALQHVRGQRAGAMQAWDTYLQDEYTTARDNALRNGSITAYDRGKQIAAAAMRQRNDQIEQQLGQLNTFGMSAVNHAKIEGLLAQQKRLIDLSERIARAGAEHSSSSRPFDFAAQVNAALAESGSRETAIALQVPRTSIPLMEAQLQLVGNETDQIDRSIAQQFIQVSRPGLRQSQYAHAMQYAGEVEPRLAALQRGAETEFRSGEAFREAVRSGAAPGGLGFGTAGIGVGSASNPSMRR